MKKLLLIILFLAFSLSSCSPSSRSRGLFKGKPEQLICQPEDLPGAYALMEDLSGPRPNDELIINVNEPAATDQYITVTGRISGWEHRFILIEPTRILPGFFLCQVVVYETVDGAKRALRWPSEEARNIEQTDRSIGDDLALTAAEFQIPDGSPWMDYRVEFTYQNVLAAVSTYAPIDIADPDYALDLAEVLFQRIQAETP